MVSLVLGDRGGHDPAPKIQKSTIVLLGGASHHTSSGTVLDEARWTNRTVEGPSVPSPSSSPSSLLQADVAAPAGDVVGAWTDYYLPVVVQDPMGSVLIAPSSALIGRLHQLNAPGSKAAAPVAGGTRTREQVLSEGEGGFLWKRDSMVGSGAVLDA